MKIIIVILVVLLSCIQALPIDECGTFTDVDTTFNLTRNLNSTTGNCLRILSSFILYGNGFSISVGPTASSALEFSGNVTIYNITIIGGLKSLDFQASEGSRVAIYNSKLQDFFDYGFYSSGSTEAQFTNNEIIGKPQEVPNGPISTYGIYAPTFVNLTVEQNRIVNVVYGILVYSSTNHMRIVDNIFECVSVANEDVYGMKLTGTSAEIRNNHFNGSGRYGIRVITFSEYVWIFNNTFGQFGYATYVNGAPKLRFDSNKGFESHNDYLLYINSVEIIEIVNNNFQVQNGGSQLIYAQTQQTMDPKLYFQNNVFKLAPGGQSGFIGIESPNMFIDNNEFSNIQIAVTTTTLIMETNTIHDFALNNCNGQDYSGITISCTTAKISNTTVKDVLISYSASCSSSRGSFTGIEIIGDAVSVGTLEIYNITGDNTGTWNLRGISLSATGASLQQVKIRDLSIKNTFDNCNDCSAVSPGGSVYGIYGTLRSSSTFYSLDNIVVQNLRAGNAKSYDSTPTSAGNATAIYFSDSSVVLQYATVSEIYGGAPGCTGCQCGHARGILLETGGKDLILNNNIVRGLYPGGTCGSYPFVADPPSGRTNCQNTVNAVNYCSSGTTLCCSDCTVVSPNICETACSFDDICNGSTCPAITTYPALPHCDEGRNNSVNPCDSLTCALHATCSADTSYTCKCNSGFSSSGSSCLNINECQDGSNDCSNRVLCTDTIGGFTCGPCPEGYYQEGQACLPFCGDSVCNGTENCLTCASDCTSPCGQCGDGECSNGEACDVCWQDCGICDVRQCTSCKNGVCSNIGVCECSAGWYGPYCDVTAFEYLDIVLGSSGSTSAIFTPGDLTLSFGITIDRIEELNNQDQVVVSHKISENVFSVVMVNKSGANTQWVYSSTFPNGALVYVSLWDFKEPTTSYVFANQTYVFAQNNVKSNIRIEEWPFKSASNKLAIWSNINHQSSSQDDPCIVTNEDENAGLFWVSVSVGEATFFTRIISNALVDDRPKTISFKASASSISALVPHFWSYAEVDPNYGVLLGSDIGNECPEEKQKKNKNRTALIVGIVVPIVIVIIFVSLFIIFYPKIKTWWTVRVSDKMDKSGSSVPMKNQRM